MEIIEMRKQRLKQKRNGQKSEDSQKTKLKTFARKMALRSILKILNS